MMRETLWQKAAGLRSNTKEQKRFLKFAVVGAIGAVVDLIVLNVLVQAVGLHELVANTFSVATAIVSNFLLNRFWSFPESRNRPFWPQLGQYGLINVAGWLFNQIIFALMLYKVLTHFPVGHPLDINVAKLVAIGVVLFWNYTVNRLTTYRGL